VAGFIERPQDPTAGWGFSRLMARPFDWIEDPRTRPRPLPSEPNRRKVILVLAAIAIVVALAIAVGEPIR
jgi:4-hydroxybenzoate polyprenyltransferase